MRHITDGELHMYLDGALDLLEDARGDQIREHLARCPVCRERLEDEEGLRSRAQNLLREPHLDVGPMPSFEDLRSLAEVGASEEESARARPEGRRRRRGPLTGLPLAWAATIVLAVGVGWMGSELSRSMPHGMLDRIPESDAGRLAIPAREATAETIREDQAPAETLEQSIAAPDREERQPPPAPTEPVARVQVTDTGNPAAKVVAEPEVEGAVRPDVEELVARQARVRPDSVLTAPRARLQVLQGQGLALEEEARRKTPGEVADSASSEGGSLIVPGLEVLSMKWEEWFPGERALHIRQLLPNRDTLELRYVGMLIGTDPAGQPRFVRGVLQENLPKDKPLSPVVMQASLPPGWNQVVTPLERGWLVARAPLPEATIMALVNFIH